MHGCMVVSLIAMLTGCDGGIKGAMNDLLKPITPPTPSEAAQAALSSQDADQRRDSINRIAAASFGGEAPYVRMYRLMLDYPDATVRAACVRALGEHGAVRDAALILVRIEDPSAFVRWEAARALQKIHNPVVVGRLIQTLGEDPDEDVRIAAALALGQHPQPRVFQALVGALNDRSFAVVDASNNSLHNLTGQDLGDDGSAWLNWAKNNHDALFDGQLTYRWQPYVKPIGLLNRIQFWKDNQGAPPRPPRGLNPPDAKANPSNNPADPT